MKETIIYLRTSTTEQTPELQMNGCLSIIKRLNILDYEKLEEQRSAYKNDDKREVFNKVLTEIKKNIICNIIVWDLDRLYRNRKKLVAFMTLCKTYNCKVYSYRQNWMDDIYKVPEPWNDILYDMMLNVMGWMAEDESKKKSDRIKNAIVKEEGKPTVSYKGKRWGRKEIKNKKMIMDILELNRQHLTMQDIASRVYYYDKSNNKINPVASSVWKIIKQNGK